MKVRTGLLLIGAGAILAFAVTAHTSGFDPRTAGYLIIMLGVLGLVIPRRASSGVRRGRLVRHYRLPAPSVAPSVAGALAESVAEKADDA